MRFLRLLCATVGFLLLGATAFAQYMPITYTLYSPGNTATFDVNYLYNGSIKNEGPVYAGPLNANVGNNVALFQVYCVDLVGVVNVGNTYSAQSKAVNVGDPNLTGDYYDNLRMAAWLYNEYESGNSNDSLNVIDSNGVYNSTNGAALQAAIWDVIEGNTNYHVGYQGAGDDFFISSTADVSGIVTQADLYLNNLLHAAPHPGDESDGVLYQADHTASVTVGQSMLGGAGSFNPNVGSVTPEGSSLLLLLPGLIPVAIGLRRRRANTPVGE